MSSRPLFRLGVIAASFTALHLGFVGCGSDDGSKHARENMSDQGGDGGESPSSGGSVSRAGSGETGGGISGSASEGGASGSPVVESGGAGAGGVEATLGGQNEGGAAGNDGAPGGGGAAGTSAGAGGAGEVVCDPVTPGSRITIAFDANNAERVTSLQWLDSSNTTITNVAASGGPQTCGDPAEFFGESYGAPEGRTPNVVVAGSRSTAAACGSNITITSAPTDCNNQPQIPTTTEYHFYSGAQASQMRITRTIGFDENSPKYTGTGVRPWQPRVVLATFASVIYPNAGETAVTTTATQSCPGDCLIPVGASWSGRWFADITASGLAIIVLRDPGMTAPVDLTINYDSYSSGNLSSFVLLQPQDGWKAPVTEVEYLCFADLTSWPQTARDAAQLPAGCGP